MTIIQNPRVVAEETGTAIIGFDYLAYQIEAMENGKKSVFYAYRDEDEDEIYFSRLGMADAFLAKGYEEWKAVPCEAFKKIIGELMGRTLPGNSCERLYPETKHMFDRDIIYKTEAGGYYRYVLEAVREGETALFGCPVSPKTKLIDKMEFVKIDGAVSPHGKLKNEDIEKGLKQFLTKGTDSDVRDFCERNRLDQKEAFHLIAGWNAPECCKGCKKVDFYGSMPPCSVCARGKIDYYEPEEYERRPLQL